MRRSKGQVEHEQLDPRTVGDVLWRPGVVRDDGRWNHQGHHLVNQDRGQGGGSLEPPGITSRQYPGPPSRDRATTAVCDASATATAGAHVHREPAGGDIDW